MKKTRDPYPITDVYLLEMNAVDAATVTVGDLCERLTNDFETGWGTGGTLSGAGKVLKAARPRLQVVAAEPEQAALLTGGDWSPHKIQGWTPDFIPDVLEKEIVDRIVPVNEDESIGTALELAKLEGIFTGISGGASLNAALKVAQETEPGSVLLAMLPDTGERYLSTPLLENVNEGTDADWLETL